MSYRDWYVGMEVVFVPKGDLRDGGYGDELLPEPETIYTIRELSIQHGMAVLRLREIDNRPREYSTDRGDEICEAWYACRSFRPVERRKTDISIFTALLEPASAPVDFVREPA